MPNSKPAGYKQTKVRAVTHVRDEPSRADLAARLAERDAMRLLDDRTPAEEWFGDPPSWRSAFASARWRDGGPCLES